MKLNQLSLAVTALGTSLMLAACGGTQSQEQTMENEEPTMEEVTTTTKEIQTQESKVQWAGTMVGVYTHTGTLDFKSGQLEMTGDKVTGGSFTIDMTTMKPTDENYNEKEGKTPDKLVGHLSSPEFFDVENHPTASFVIKSNEGGSLKGDLTLRGNTHEETVENVSYDAASNTWSGKMTVDRKKYDVSWDSPMQEMVLSDELEIKVSLVL